MTATPADVATRTELIELPTQELLEQFGAGNHKPGSGSAAALLGLLATKLVTTVIKLTLPRPDYRSATAQLEFIQGQIDSKFEPSLKSLFQKDSEAFHRVVEARRLRDAETDRKKKHDLENEARLLLRPATEIPIDISELCVGVARLGLTVFDLGYQSARGDSGAAISSAIGGANAGLSVVYLNVRSFRDAEMRMIRDRADRVLRESEELQGELFARFGKLQIAETNPQMELQLR